MMADATDRWDKQHGGRQCAREPLSVVPCAGRHANVLTGCAVLRRAIKRRLERLVHHGGRAGAEPLNRELAAPALIDHPRQDVKLAVQSIEYRRVGGTKLKTRPRGPGDEALLPRSQ